MSDHYFSEEPTVSSAPTFVDLDVRGLKASLAVDAGIFSPGRIDPGTSLLLRATIPPRVPGPLLDLGCGYGPIGLTLAARHPERTVYAVDVNSRALALTAVNAEKLGLANVVVCKPEDVPRDVEFGGIYSNPPIKSGKATLHAMLQRWLARMSQGAGAFFVVHKHLGSDSLAKWIETEGWGVARITSSRGYRILRVTTLAEGVLTEPGILSERNLVADGVNDAASDGSRGGVTGGFIGGAIDGLGGEAQMDSGGTHAVSDES